MKKVENSNTLTGYPSIDKPWLKYYPKYGHETPLPNCNLFEYLKMHNEDNQENTALEFYGTFVSYGLLFKRIERTAQSLSALGIKENEIVSVCMLNTPETIYLIYALNMLGAVANLICPTSPAEEMQNVISECNSRFIFTLDIFQEKIAAIVDKTDIQKVIVANLNTSMSLTTKIAAAVFKKLKTVKLFKDSRFISWNNFLSQTAPAENISNPDAVAAIVYTGGTSGNSKGVELTNQQINMIAWQNLNGVVDFKRNQKNAELLPFFIAYGLIVGLHVPCIIGVHQLIRLPMTETLNQVLKHKPNIIITIPNAWYELAKADKNIDLSFLTYAATGGDLLSPAIEEKIVNYLKKQNGPSILANGYGMSEVGAQATTSVKEIYKFSTGGVPLLRNIIAAFDLETGEELKYGEEGELCIQSPSLMKDYRNNEEATNEVIKVHKDGLKWIHTGDLGYIDSDGFVHVSGRLKRFFIRTWKGGVKKVFCPIVEQLMLKCPLIENCILVPKTIGIEHKVFAFIIPADKSMKHDDLINSIKAYCNDNLEKIYRPDYFKLLDKYPLTKINKINFRALEEQTETTI